MQFAPAASLLLLLASPPSCLSRHRYSSSLAQHQPLIITHTAFVTFNKSASRSTLYMWRVTHLLSILFISRTSSHQLCRSLFRIVRGAWLGQKWSELMFLSLWPFFSVVVTDPHLLHHFYLLSAQLPDSGHTFTSPKCESLKKYIIYWRYPSSSLITDCFHWCHPDSFPQPGGGMVRV